MPVQLVPLIAGTTPTITLERPAFLVGRHPDCDQRIDLPQVSRRHCCFALADDRIVIRDLGSRHGVWVNGRRVEECQLRHGDEVALGSLLFRVVASAVPTQTPIANQPQPPPAQKPQPPSFPVRNRPSDEPFGLSNREAGP